MIRYERHQLWKWWEIILDILNEYKEWTTYWERNLNSKDFWNWKKIWFLFLSLPLLFSLAYLYMWIQNAFVPYSTAWDANHEYMYIPKILAENAGIYRWNSITAATMPWFWSQFLTFVFSLTWCTNWWFGLSPDNIAISMNNISAFLVLVFWIAIIFQAFTLIKNKKTKEKSELKKWKNTITNAATDFSNKNWISIWWYLLLLWLTSWMWAFLVIVDNKTDLWVMALSLLALLAGLIFLQNREISKEKNELLKYILVTGLFFWFATLAKVTAFVDLVLFWVLLIWLWFSSTTTLGIWIMITWLVRKFHILSADWMITDTNATRLIIIWWITTIIWLIIHLSKQTNRKNFWKNFKDLLLLWIWFIIPLILFKLPRTTISQIKNNNFSISSSIKTVFLGMDTKTKKDNYKLLAQNEHIEEISNWDIFPDTNTTNSIEQQDQIDSTVLGSKKYWNFEQCISAWNIYSDLELGESMQEASAKSEDLWRYIGYWWKEFVKTNILNIDQETAKKKWFKFFKTIWPKSEKCSETSNADNIICEKNLTFWIMKILWPTSKTCYWFNHDAKILCNNANIIDSFKIDDLRAIYENWINNQNWEAGILLKNAIDAYDKAEFEWKIWSDSNVNLFHDEIVKLRQYYQSNSILSTENSINIPYRYLVPLNISFNRSLQNLSSYYTDIGFIWIILYILLLIALPYAIVKKDKILTSFSLTTLIWRWIWWIIWSAILWYWTVLISWTIITLAIFWDELLLKNDKNNPRILPRIIIIFVGIIFWIQIIFNYLRIASQWASSVFVWYKWNIGNEQFIDDNLQQNIRNKRWYTWKDIFNLQFPQYNPIIHTLADRNKNDWVTVAGTYIQYFLWNQRNVKWDWMLSKFWDKTYRKKSSNLDLCKTYRRLKNENTHYFIIDPNIWTVSMWEWNETLFYRFFAKLNADKSKIITDWAITTFIRFYTLWYLKLLSTNNIWTKYAFTLDNDTIRTYFWENLTDEDLVLTRWKMAVLQYFDDANSIFSTLAEIFVSRIINDTKNWVEDIANIYWFEIDSDNVANIAKKYIKEYLDWKLSEWIAKDLTQDERTILITYINLYLWYQHGWENEISSIVQNILLNSVTWWSQVFALELN